MSGQRTYLITGGLGFIGSHLVDALLSDEKTKMIIIIDHAPCIYKYDNRVKIVKADIREPLTIEVNQPIDICFHLAAVCREPGYTRQEYFDTNHTGTKNVIALVVRLCIPRIIFTSTIMVYPAGDQQCDELSSTEPNTAYGESKILAEYELLKWSQNNGKLRIIRPGVVFGPRDYGNFIRLYKALKSGLFCYIGRKTTVKGSIYVKDLVDCLRFLETDASKNNIYNATFPKSYTIGEIVKTICTVKGWHRWVPIVPYQLARALAKIGEGLNAIGFTNGIHPRRIDKLYYSTNIIPKALIQDGFIFKYDLYSAIKEWLSEYKYEDMIIQ